MSETLWWYIEADEKRGPHTVEELEALLKAGTISPETHVWRAGMDGTAPIYRLMELKLAMRGYYPPSDPALLSDFSDRPGVWSRFFARSMDLLLWVFPIGFGIGLLMAGRKIDLPPWALYALALPFGSLFLLLILALDALVLAAFGTTFGKWLFGLKIRRFDGGRITTGPLLRRSVRLWIRGYGLNLPLVNLVCLFFAYAHARRADRSSWDETTLHTVHQKPITRLHFSAAVGVFLLLYAAPSVLQTYSASTQEAWTNPLTQVSTKLPAGWRFDSAEDEQYFFLGAQGQVILTHQSAPGLTLDRFADLLQQQSALGAFKDRYAAVGDHGRFIQLLFLKKIEGRDWQLNLRLWQRGEQDFWNILTLWPVSAGSRVDLDRTAEVILKTVPER